MKTPRLNLTRLKGAKLEAAVNAAMVKHLGLPSTIEHGRYELRGAGNVLVTPLDAARYATSLDTVVPVMQEAFSVAKVEYVQPSPRYAYRVDLYRDLSSAEPAGYGLAPTLPLAICIALLRAKGVEVRS